MSSLSGLKTNWNRHIPQRKRSAGRRVGWQTTGVSWPLSFGVGFSKKNEG